MSDRSNSAVLAEPDLVITRTFDAPRRLVFALWTDPRHARAWWGPADYPATHVEIGRRPGDPWRCCLRSTQDGRELWQGGGAARARRARAPRLHLCLG